MAKVTVEIDRKREVEECYRLWAAALPGTEKQLGRPITPLVVGQEIENRIELVGVWIWLVEGMTEMRKGLDGIEKMVKKKLGKDS